MNSFDEKVLYALKREDYPDSAYVYDLKIVERNCSNVQKTFEKFNVLYSMKANPNISILQTIKRMGIGIDAASKEEVDIAYKCGFIAQQIFYSSPGKSEKDITESIDRCIIIADSIGEVERICEIAKERKTELDIGIRINVENADIKNNAFEIMSGIPTKFGIRLEQLIKAIEICSTCMVNIVGIHVYFGSQILSENVIKQNIYQILECARKTLKMLDLEFVNIGGGFGIPYKNEEPLDLMKIIDNKISEGVYELLKKGVICNLELGRYLVANAGVFVSRVNDIKDDGNTKYIVLSAGMNGFFRPIFTSEFHMLRKLGLVGGEREKVTVVGNLCTPLDQYYKDYLMERLEVGDMVIFENAGAYGYSMSMLKFCSHSEPREIII